MLNSLENICKKKLCIDESIPVTDIVDFLEKNKIFNLDSLFLINFKKRRAISLNSEKVHEDCTYKILGFKELGGRYGKYYHIYCRINCGEKYKYRVFISNKKLTSRIDDCFHEKLDLGISSFKKNHIGYKKIETIGIKKELEKLKDIKIFKDSFWEKVFSKNYIYFLPRELKNYKSIIYREIDFI